VQPVATKAARVHSMPAITVLRAERFSIGTHRDAVLPAKFAQPLHEGDGAIRRCRRGGRAQIAYDWNFALLRPGSERTDDRSA